MQAIELVAQISAEHELHLRLPEHTATGSARIIVLFETDAPPSRRGNLDDFLDSLPLNRSGGIGRDAIMRGIDEERAGWDEH